MGTGGYVFPVFLMPVTEELGWSRTAYALANPIMSTSVALIGPLVGWLSDRRGPRAVLVAGSLLMSASLMAAGRMQTPMQFYVIALGIGIAVACLGDLPDRRRHRRSLSRAAWPRARRRLHRLEHRRRAGAARRHGVGDRRLVAHRAHRHRRRAVDHAPAAGAERERAARTRGGATARATTASPGATWCASATSGSLFWVLFAFYLYRLGLNTHLVAFLRDLGYSSLEAAGSFSLTLAIGIVGKLLAGAVADRLGARPAVLANFTLIAIASLLLLFPSVRGALPAFLVLHGFATAAEDVVIPLIIAQRFGSEHLGRVYGLLLLALVPGGVVGPIVAGRVYDLYESYTPVFTAFAIANITAVAALALVRRSPQRAQRPL